MNVTTQLQTEADFFQVQSEIPFGNELWAQEVKGLEKQGIALLGQMGGYILQLDTSLRTSLNSHVMRLSGNLSSAMRVNIGDRLSQTLNANAISGNAFLGNGFLGMQSSLNGVNSTIQMMSNSLSTPQRAAQDYSSVSGSQRHGKSDGGSSNMCWDQNERAYTNCNYLKQYAIGTSYVPNTGPAILHEGEMVLDRELSDSLRDYGIPVSQTTVPNQFVVPIIQQNSGQQIEKQIEKLEQQNQILFALLEQQKKLFENQNNVIANSSTKIERAVKAPKAAR
ncbi:MAG: hypothetical protein VSS75_008090 [Candidatus Parabeggiatoa sp.]|nr:hypothetical protein [Candidatus Parabeggiatoa sp.]